MAIPSSVLAIGWIPFVVVLTVCSYFKHSLDNSLNRSSNVVCFYFCHQILGFKNYSHLYVREKANSVLFSFILMLNTEPNGTYVKQSLLT